MQNQEKTNDQKKREIFGKAIIIFFMTILLLTLFSRTIQNILLPRVTIAKPRSGILVYEVNGTGSIIPSETLKIYPKSTKKVKDFMVETGEKVNKGQVIAVLSGKSSAEAEIELKILENKLEKLLLETKDSQLEIQQLELEKALKEMNKLAADLKKKEKLLETGGVTINQIEEEKYNLEIASKDYQQKKIEFDNARNNQQISRQKNKKEIEVLHYELELQRLKIAQLQEEEIIISPFDGIIKEIYYQRGELAFENEPVCSIINTKKGFIFSASLDIEKNSLISVGDTISIILKSRNKTINRPIEKIIIKDNYKELRAVIEETDFLGGEKFDYRIIKRSKSYNTIIPNTALGRDNGGYFVYIIKEREGALGKEYYVKKEYITTGDSDNQNTVVAKGLENRTSIVYSFEKIITDGSRVWPQQRK